MSINGFRINGNVERYDYQHLDNLPDLKSASGEETRNLFYDNNITLFDNLSESNGVFTNTAADTRGYLSIHAVPMNGSSAVQDVLFDSVTIGRNHATFTASGNATSMVFKHNGAERDLAIRFTCDIQQGNTYTISFKLIDSRENVIGGFVFSELQVELGTTMSAYIPHITSKDQELRETFRRVEEFGVTGDGVTDCTNNLKQAIASGTNVLYFNGGTYIVRDHISIPSNIKIIGQNKTVIKWVDCVTTSATSYIGGQNLENVTFENITFDFGPLSVLRLGMSILDSINITITNCIFKNCYGYASRFNGCSNLRIEKCDFKDITGAAGNPGGGIFGQGFHDVFVTGCSCSNLGDHFLYCAGDQEVYNVIVSDCNLKTTGVNDLTNGAAITLYATCHDVNITNCIFTQVRQGLYIGQYGESTGLPFDVNISNCTFKNLGTRAIEVFGISARNYVQRVNISNCTIFSGIDGVLLRHANRLSLSNLKIQKPTRTGMEVSDVHQSIFTNIVLNDVTDIGVRVSNPSFGPDSSENIFNGIIVTPASSGVSETSYGFYIRGGANNIVTNVIAFGFTENIIRNGVPSGGFNINEYASNRSILFTNDITESKYHISGDIIFNSAPTSGNPVMWVCTADGAPGTLTPVIVMP